MVSPASGHKHRKINVQRLLRGIISARFFAQNVDFPCSQLPRGVSRWGYGLFKVRAIHNETMLAQATVGTVNSFAQIAP